MRVRFLASRSKKLDYDKIQYPIFILHPDGWDDYSLKTTFQLNYARSRHKITPVGTVKILRRKQESGATQLPSIRFPTLSKVYCSIGSELDYYETLLREFGRKDALRILKALRDISIDEAHRATFVAERGYETSLLRFSTARQALTDAGPLFGIGARAAQPPELKFTFNTDTGGRRFAIHFDFGGPKDLPGRLNVLVGANGVGKTRLLANLALAAFDAGQDGNPSASDWGSFDPRDIGFGRILAFSYSAFDHFDLPGTSAAQKKLFDRRDIALGYRYCGLREIHRDAILKRKAESKTKRRSRVERKEIGSYGSLKTPAQLANDFRRALNLSLDEPRRAELLTALGLLLEDSSFGAIGLLTFVEMDQNATKDKLSSSITETFKGLSAGHKIVLLMVTQLAAYLRKKALVLIDEPEAHLHPPLLAAFLRSLRSLLDSRQAFAIIATHSPILVQETPSRHVRIVTRSVTQTDVLPPDIETFGEDLGTIIRESFKLDTRATDFRVTLRTLATRLSLEEIEALFEKGLSTQARAIVLAAKARQ